jgi:hypothetical protein
MDNQSIENMTIPRHKKLLRFAKVIQIAAWVISVGFVLKLIGDLRLTLQFQSLNAMAQSGQLPWYIWQVVVSYLITILRGAGFWLVLMGISVGIRLVVETDKNYRLTDSDQGEISAQEVIENAIPSYYEPEYVLKLSEWMSAAAIISIILSVLMNLFAIRTTYPIVLSFFSVGPDKSALAWTITGAIFLVGAALESIILYFFFKSLGTILHTLMEMEFNSRGT